MNEKLSEWEDKQRRIFIDVEQVYEQYRAVQRELEDHKGGLTWKTAHGRSYLFRLRDRRGNGRSLGPRSPETEAIHEAFHKRKALLRERFKGLRETLTEQARFTRAARLNRLPKRAAAVLRELDRHHLFDDGLAVDGTYALYAYEAMAGVRISPDLLRGDCLQLRLAHEHRRSAVLAALRKVNATGVDVHPAQPGDVLSRAHTPTVEQTVIATDGHPVHMVVPVPSVFAQSATDREQAEVVGEIVRRYLPPAPA